MLYTTKSQFNKYIYQQSIELERRSYTLYTVS